MRSLPEWIGKTDDAPIPPRVQLRVFERFHGRCQCGCNRKIATGEAWELDHVKALINGGEHRESNLQPLLKEHHKAKTVEDVSEKSITYKKKLMHHGIKKTRWRPLIGTKASGWRKRLDGTIERR